jgi:riboflavin kinase
MKPYLLEMLKELALIGATKNRVEISSLELAKQLDTSQQTASRYLLELDKNDLITREMGIKKQLIKITSKGEGLLHKEFFDYQQIFELADKIQFAGRVVSGMGEGRYYTEQKGYADQFKDKLGFVPHPGTLNIEIKNIERNKLRLLKDHTAILIDEFETNNRTFGGVRCFHASINGVDGAIVLPIRSHYSNILELISPYYLRDTLKVDDCDTVKVIIYL